MTSLYEAMFLLDNQLVRQDWGKAKGLVTELLEKHGATVKSARRWDERRLAYPIKRRNRASFLLTDSEIPGAGLAPLRRDLELNESVLRYLFLRTDEVPQEEVDLTAAETSSDFVVPLPPEDHEVDEEPAAQSDDSDDEPGERRARKPAASSDDDDDDDSSDDTEDTDDSKED